MTKQPRSHPPKPGRSRCPFPRALAKAAAKRTGNDLPVHSFDSLLADLATICHKPDPAR